MVQENEVITLLLGLGTAIFLLWNHKRLRNQPYINILFAAFFVLVSGWILTVLEGYFWAEELNVLEHLCYAGCSILLATWCGLTFRKRTDRQ